MPYVIDGNHNQYIVHLQKGTLKSKGTFLCSAKFSPWERRFILHPLADLFSRTPTRVLLQALNHAAITARRRFGHGSTIARYQSIGEWTEATRSRRKGMFLCRCCLFQTCAVSLTLLCFWWYVKSKSCRSLFIPEKVKYAILGLHLWLVDSQSGLYL